MRGRPPTVDSLHVVDQVADELVSLFAESDPLLSALSLRRAAERIDRERRRSHVPRGARHLRRADDEPAELRRPVHRVLLERRT